MYMDMIVLYTLVASNIKIVQKWLPNYFTSTIKFRKEGLSCLKVSADIKRLELV